MPQTREHVAILELLGVRTAVVALTKRDLVDAETAELARADVEELLAGTALAGARDRGDLGAHRHRPRRAARGARRGRGNGRSRARRRGATRLPVDRAFTLRGIGTVVTGHAVVGLDRAPATGSRSCPAGGEVRVRSVEVHDQPVERAQAGQRVAASLVGVERSAIARGATLATPGALPESYRLDVELRGACRAARASHTARSCRCCSARPCVDARVALLDGRGARRRLGRARAAAPARAASRRRAATA